LGSSSFKAPGNGNKPHANFQMGMKKRKIYADASSEKVKGKKFTLEINEQKAC
jgi:hypothetical protein